MKIVVNSAHPVPQTRDFKELTEDAFRRNCTHDVVSEIQRGTSKLNFAGILLTISTKVRETFSF